MKFVRPLALLLFVGCAPEPPPRPVRPAIVRAVATEAAKAPEEPPPVLRSPPRCVEARDVTLFASPEHPHVGGRIVGLAVSDSPLFGSLVIARGNESLATASVPTDGPPYTLKIELLAPPSGDLTLRFAQDPRCEAPDVEKKVAITEGPERRAQASWGVLWPAKSAWTPEVENLYSAWVYHLFDAPLGEELRWNALSEVLSNPKRNLLHNHLGWDEDKDGLRLRPDCADLPYFLRGYFAFKLGLPFGYASCSRGSRDAPPTCTTWANNYYASSAKRLDPAESFAHFLRFVVADAVHSGSGRLAAEDESGDYYPVSLSKESIRPGTIFADPYGHILVVTRRIPQDKAQAGVLLAVDGQPDGTVARKRFWRGNFLFATDPALGGAGFKRFRPVITDRKGKGAMRGLRKLSNQEIGDAAGYRDFSTEQYAHGVDGFYDKVEGVLSPEPLDAEQALLEVITALEEQVKARVASVENGRKFLRRGGAADMPDGPALFETTGAWEDFSTPSRDLRLLIAMDVVANFVERFSKHPERFRNSGDVDAEKKRLEARVAEELAKRTITYTKSDEAPMTLTLADVMQRREALEMGYNPNDCVEIRWGAPEGSDERTSCKRRAPWGQTSKMRRVRNWFHERKRPPRP